MRHHPPGDDVYPAVVATASQKTSRFVERIADAILSLSQASDDSLIFDEKEILHFAALRSE